MDSYFWTADSDGSGSTLNADLLGGFEGSAISSGIENGVIGFWYGTLANFTGKLLTGYLNWHIADGTDGSEDLTDQFPIGASAVGSGYQVGTQMGNKTFKPAGSVLISSHILTIAEIMHIHNLEDDYAAHGGNTELSAAGSGPCASYVQNLTPSITSSVGGKLVGGVYATQPHVHDATFEGSAANLLPPFMALIPVQFGNYSGGVWSP